MTSEQLLFIVVVAACFAVLLTIAIAYQQPAVLLLGVLVWFLPRLVLR